MKQTVTLNDFKEKFYQLRPNQFSDAALEALFQQIAQYEIETDDETELDVIALCCDYSEYASIDDVIEDYNLNKLSEDPPIEQKLDLVRDYTIVIPFENGVIIQNF